MFFSADFKGERSCELSFWSRNGPITARRDKQAAPGIATSSRACRRVVPAVESRAYGAKAKEQGQGLVKPKLAKLRWSVPPLLTHHSKCRALRSAPGRLV